MTEQCLTSLLDIFAKDYPEERKYEAISSLVWMGATQQMNIVYRCANNEFYYIKDGVGPGPGFMYEEIINVDTPEFGHKRLVSFIPLDKIENIGFYVDKNESMFSKLKESSLSGLVIPIKFNMKETRKKVSIEVKYPVGTDFTIDDMSITITNNGSTVDTSDLKMVNGIIDLDFDKSGTYDINVKTTNSDYSGESTFKVFVMR